MTDPAYKAREARARRKAQRQGLELRRARTRDPDAPTFGRYQLVRVGARGATTTITKWLPLSEIELELMR